MSNYSRTSTLIAPSLAALPVTSTTNDAATSKRIRTPSNSDVLLGRGGGINGHVGNKVFRDWVKVRKEDYNLAPTKAEKARVAHEVMDKVKSRGGRFLQRVNAPGMAGWWVPVPETRALAKTSQALREGAPQIRAAASTQESTNEAPKKSRSSRRNAATTTTSRKKRKSPEASPPEPAISNTSTSRKSARRTVQHTPIVPKSTTWPQTVPVASSSTNPTATVIVPKPPVDASAETPPLAAAVPPLLLPEDLPPHLDLSAPALSTASEEPVVTTITIGPPPAPEPKKQQHHLRRSHSLAMSDVSESNLDQDEDFVNPFLDETETLEYAAKAKAVEAEHKTLPWYSNVGATPKRNVSTSRGPMGESIVPRESTATRITVADDGTVAGGAGADRSANSMGASDSKDDYDYHVDPTDDSEEIQNENKYLQQHQNPTPYSKDHHHHSRGDDGSRREDFRSMAELYDFVPHVYSNSSNNNSSNPPGDFNEGLKSVWEAVQDQRRLRREAQRIDAKGEHDSDHEDDNVGGVGKEMPTLLIPWRGGFLKRRYSKFGLSTSNSSSGNATLNPSSPTSVEPGQKQ